MSKVFYIPGEPTAIDYALELTDGQYVTNWTRETLEQLAQRHPGVVIGEENSFIWQQRRALSTSAEEITEAEYHAAMSGPWPPLVWQLGDGVESFKGCEQSGDHATFIYVRKGARYWRFQGVSTLSHPVILRKISSH